MKLQYATQVLVIISAVLFVVHQYLQLIAHINITFLDNYLDPFVMMPILLYLLVWERRLLLRKRTLLLPNTHIFGYFVLAVIFGEVLFPLLNKRFTADYWDILSYGLGSLIYGIVQQINMAADSKPLSD